VLEQARATLAVVDLVRGRVAARVAVGTRPARLVVDGGTVWIAHAAGGALTRLDVARPTRPRLLAPVVTGGPVGALVADADPQAVFVSTAGEVIAYRDGSTRAELASRTALATAPVTGLAVVAPQLLVAAGRGGALSVLLEKGGSAIARLRGAGRVRELDAYGGWLVAVLPRGLTLTAVPDGSMRTNVSFGTGIGGFAWAVP
jgi:hypothetical protein